MKVYTVNEAKELCFAAARNGYFVTPSAPIPSDKEKMDVKQCVTSDLHIAAHKPITEQMMGERWEDYEEATNSCLKRNKESTLSMFTAWTGHQIPGGYYLLGIDLDYTDKAKIAEVEKIIKCNAQGVLVGKVGSKGVTYFVKAKFGKFAPYKRKSGEEYEIDWLTGSKGDGHYACFIPPGVNHRTREPYKWISDATLFNTPASNLITVDATHYHEILCVTDAKKINESGVFKVGKESLASRIAQIKKYKTGTDKSSGEFEPNLLDNCTFFGRMLKGVAGKTPFLPDAEGFANWYYRLWMAAYERDGKQGKPDKSIDYIIEKIQGTEAPAGDGELDKEKVAQDTKEYLYWMEKHGEDNLAYAGGMVREYDDTTGYWMPLNDEAIYYEILHRIGCSSGIAKSAMVSIVNAVKRNDHTANIEDELENGTRFALAKIAFKNCTVSITRQGIKTGPHKKENYALYGINYDYKPDTECPKIVEMMNQLFLPDRMEVDGELEDDDKLFQRRDDNVKMIVQFLGWSLVPFNGFAKSLFIYGASRTGKSVFAKLHKYFLNSGGQKLVCPDLSITNFHEPNAVDMIRGKALAICSDDDGNPSKQDISIWKKWLGGDPLTVKTLYKDVESILPTAKYMHISNTKVDFNTTDQVAIHERLITIQATSRTIAKDKRDVDFIDSLKSQEEMEGYAAMLVGALNDLFQSNRFVLAEWQEEEVKTSTTNSNPVGEFLEESLKNGRLTKYDPQIHKAGRRVTTEEMKDIFLTWMNTDIRKRDMQYWGSKQRIADSANTWFRENGMQGWTRTSVRVDGISKTKFVYQLVEMSVGPPDKTIDDKENKK